MKNMWGSLDLGGENGLGMEGKEGTQATWDPGAGNERRDSEAENPRQWVSNLESLTFKSQHVTSWCDYVPGSCFCCCYCLVTIYKLYLTVLQSIDCSPPGCSVHGISQARILEWVAIFFSRGSSRPRNRTCVSCVGRWILYHWATREAPHHPL